MTLFAAFRIDGTKGERRAPGPVPRTILVGTLGRAVLSHHSKPIAKTCRFGRPISSKVYAISRGLGGTSLRIRRLSSGQVKTFPSNTRAAKRVWFASSNRPPDVTKFDRIIEIDVGVIDVTPGRRALSMDVVEPRVEPPAHGVGEELIQRWYLQDRPPWIAISLYALPDLRDLAAPSRPEH
jgi:hypothetical protein